MTKDKVKCDLCDSLVLESTKAKCGGYCMRCYMKNNHGFRPLEIDSIKERGLMEKFDQWNNLVREGVPNVRNPLIYEQLNQSVSVLYQSVVSYFRSNVVRYDGNNILKVLAELKSTSNDDVDKYVAKVEGFILGLI